MAKFITVVLMLLVVLAACQMNRAQNNYHNTYTLVAEGTLDPGDTVPKPTGPVVLSLTGKIGLTNAPNRLDFDMATLEKMRMVTYEVNDPDLKREATYQGVLLKDVLDLARAAPDAKDLYTSALDDYKTTVPKDVIQWPVMIATTRDGSRISIDKGPLEIVFPNQSFQFDPARYNPMWVWQLRSIEVR